MQRNRNGQSVTAVDFATAHIRPISRIRNFKPDHGSEASLIVDMEYAWYRFFLERGFPPIEYRKCLADGFYLVSSGLI